MSAPQMVRAKRDLRDPAGQLSLTWEGTATRGRPLSQGTSWQDSSVVLKVVGGSFDLGKKKGGNALGEGMVKEDLWRWESATAVVGGGLSVEQAVGRLLGGPVWSEVGRR